MQIISALSANTEAKYLTDGFWQRFVPTPEASLVYQPLKAFLAYTADMSHISVIYDRDEPITSLITQHFQKPISFHQDYPLHITSYNLVYIIPRSASYSKSVWIQCERLSKFGTIFGHSLPDLTPYITTYWNIVPNYINAKLTDMGAQHILFIVLTTNTITEFSKYKFNMASLTVSRKHVKLPSQKDDLKIIAGLKEIEKIFKVDNIQ